MCTNHKLADRGYNELTHEGHLGTPGFQIEHSVFCALLLFRFSFSGSFGFWPGASGFLGVSGPDTDMDRTRRDGIIPEPAEPSETVQSTDAGICEKNIFARKDGWGLGGFRGGGGGSGGVGRLEVGGGFWAWGWEVLGFGIGVGRCWDWVGRLVGNCPKLNYKFGRLFHDLQGLLVAQDLDRGVDAVLQCLGCVPRVAFGGFQPCGSFDF